MNVNRDEWCSWIQLHRKPLDFTGLLQNRIARTEQTLSQSALYRGTESNLQNSAAFRTCHVEMTAYMFLGSTQLECLIRHVQ
jgi:hypothetical protein